MNQTRIALKTIKFHCTDGPAATLIFVNGSLFAMTALALIAEAAGL